MLIAFAGCDGSGKSTQIKRIQKWLENRGDKVLVLNRWDIFNTSKFPECRFISANIDDLRVCINEMEGISRAMFLFWSISITLQKNNLYDPNTYYLLDSYWMKHGAVEIEYGCEPHWIESTISCLPYPDITFYFDVTPEVALSRKSQLNAYECGRNPELDPKDFIIHQTKIRKRLHEWSKKFGWICISSLQNPDVITEEVQRYIINFIA